LLRTLNYNPCSVRLCTKALHEGSARRFCTKALHEGSARRLCTKALHEGSARRLCIQRLYTKTLRTEALHIKALRREALYAKPLYIEPPYAEPSCRAFGCWNLRAEPSDATPDPATTTRPNQIIFAAFDSPWPALQRDVGRWFVEVLVGGQSVGDVII